MNLEDLVRGTLAKLVFFSLFVASVGAEKNLAEYCARLSNSMASIPEVRTNARLAMTEGLKQVRSLSNVLKGERLKLATAWEAVVKRAPCESSSGEHVAVISKCAPEKHPELASLFEAVRRYAPRCLTANFWDYQLRKSLESFFFFTPEEKSQVSRLLSDQFIKLYRAHNLDEPKVHLGNGQVKGEPCCRPWRSHQALVSALTPLVGTLNNAARLAHMIKFEKAQFERLLNRHLFKPCENYLSHMRPLIRALIYASKYYPNGREDFVQRQLSEQFQNAIFRYKYCHNFHNLAGVEFKLKVIGYQPFWQFVATD